MSRHLSSARQPGTSGAQPGGPALAASCACLALGWRTLTHRWDASESGAPLPGADGSLPAPCPSLRGRESEIERIARVAFDAAMKRGKRLCSVEKSNVLEVRGGRAAQAARRAAACVPA